MVLSDIKWPPQSESFLILRLLFKFDQRVPIQGVIPVCATMYHLVLLDL